MQVSMVGLQMLGLELKESYLLIGDPTEYRFALKCAGGWKAWEILSNSEEWKETVADWRSELAAKLRSEALARIIETSKGETRDAINASKYIYEALADKDKVGRPSKESIKLEAKKLVQDRDRIAEDYERVQNAIQEGREE